MQQHDDAFAFLDEELDGLPRLSGKSRWQVLIVDDDHDVHQATQFALRDVPILGRALEFLHAYSGQEAIEMLGQYPDVAVVLLDVVMEKESSGLEVVERIRHHLNMRNIRIILRTGQPGYAPELEAISGYDINDYKTKADLTRSKLYTTLTSAIRSFDQIQRLDASRRALELIVGAANSFVAEQGAYHFAQTVIEQMASLLQVPANGLLCVCEPQGEVRAVRGLGAYARLDGCSLNQLAETGVRQLLADCLASRNICRGPAGLAVHVPARSGRNFAVFLASTVDDEPDAHLLDVFFANVAICGDNVDLVQRLRDTAYVDSLTGLPNRAAQIEAIDARLASGDTRPLALCLIDIDQFSETIDAFGYHFGDVQLRAVAARLQHSLPADVLLARVGGDVFAVFGVTDVVNPGLIRELLTDAFDCDGDVLEISFSLGFVEIANGRENGAGLLRNGAIALKRAKMEGPGHDAHYTPEVGVLTRERVRLLQDLRVAFSERFLFLTYQPQIELATGKVVGVEALLRWKTPDGTFVPPDRFIPVAEQSGLIVSLGGWVLRTALDAQRQLRRQGFDLRMAVNVSAVQFRHPGFFDEVRQALADMDADPSRVELEITESVAMFGAAHFEEGMQAIKTMGLRVAIDDFGTGFSSLSYLDRMPADCLKIDRSFVNTLDHGGSGARIAETVVHLGTQLGMRVLAEGVETERQVQTLIDLGCHEVQGWHYAKAMELDALAHWLKGRA